MKAPVGDVGTTARPKLTPTQRLALYEAHRGICAVCSNRIEGEFIAEHWRALGLGGGAKGANLVVAHPKCAAIKTKADLKAIAKSKRVKMAAHGIKRKVTPIKSRNDLKAAPKPGKIKKLPIPGAMPPLMRQGFVPATEVKRK